MCIILFVGITLTMKVSDNSVKYMIKVQSWPFLSNRNYLQIIMRTEAKSENLDTCLNSESGVDGNKNLKWFTLNIDGVSLYPHSFSIFFSFVKLSLLF